MHRRTMWLRSSSSPFTPPDSPPYTTTGPSSPSSPSLEAGTGRTIRPLRTWQVAMIAACIVCLVIMIWIGMLVHVTSEKTVLSSTSSSELGVSVTTSNDNRGLIASMNRPTTIEMERAALRATSSSHHRLTSLVSSHLQLITNVSRTLDRTKRGLIRSHHELMTRVHDSEAEMQRLKHQLAQERAARDVVADVVKTLSEEQQQQIATQWQTIADMTQMESSETSSSSTDSNSNDDNDSEINRRLKEASQLSLDRVTVTSLDNVEDTSRPVLDRVLHHYFKRHAEVIAAGRRNKYVWLDTKWLGAFPFLTPISYFTY
jgi:hypothetical protein